MTRKIDRQFLIDCGFIEYPFGDNKEYSDFIQRDNAYSVTWIESEEKNVTMTTEELITKIIKWTQYTAKEDLKRSIKEYLDKRDIL